MAVVKQNISNEASFSPRRAYSPLALLRNSAGWGSLWYNDSAVILSIRVGGMGDGMDTRLINSLTYLWRRGTLGTTLSYLYSKKWNPLDLALGWGGKEQEEKENIKFKIFPFVHNFWCKNHTASSRTFKNFFHFNEYIADHSSLSCFCALDKLSWNVSAALIICAIEAVRGMIESNLSQSELEATDFTLGNVFFLHRKLYTICGSLGEVVSPRKFAQARTSVCLATCTESPLCGFPPPYPRSWVQSPVLLSQASQQNLRFERARINKNKWKATFSNVGTLTFKSCNLNEASLVLDTSHIPKEYRNMVNTIVFK